MKAPAYTRFSRGVFLLPFAYALLAGCFGTGEGQQPIPGTPRVEDPGGGEEINCENNINFEDVCGAEMFMDFAGGSTAVVENPGPDATNDSEKVARMQKFMDQPFGGTTLALAEEIDFDDGAIFRVAVFAERAVPMLFKFEGLDQELTLEHTGSGRWEALCYDFTGMTEGPDPTGITIIFDNGVQGDAANDPINWTFYFDEVEQLGSCDDVGGGGGDDGALDVDFEGDAADFDFGEGAGFGGGVTIVTANPDTSGINPSPQAARYQKFMAEPFGGSTLSLGRNIDFGEGEVFRIKVRAERRVPLLFKLEGLDQERTLEHSGSGAWEELCYDFRGATAGNPSNAITFIFDNGVVGDADNDPTNWTFFLDDIEQDTSCPGDDPGDGGDGGDAFSTITFDDGGVTYALRGFGGAEDSTVVADPGDASNMVGQVNRSDAAETFAGTVVSTGDNETVGVIGLDAMAPQMTVRVLSPAAGIPVRLKIENSADPAISVETEAMTTVGNAFETLTFDFTNQAEGTPAFNAMASYDRVAIFFNFGATGGDAGAQTFLFDDIAVVGGDDGGGDDGGDATAIDFEGDPAGFDFGPDGGFGGGLSTVIDNPVPGGINTSAQVVRMEKFAGEVFGGSTLALPEAIDFAEGAAFTMKVWSQRMVPVTFKLEGLDQERADDHDGGAVWQELCFDFAGSTEGAPATGITVFFDLGVNGDAANDPDNWTFYYDDIQQTASCGGDDDGGDAPAAFETVTFDDPNLTYALRGFGGGEDASLVVDPVDASSMVLRVIRSDAAETFAGTVISTGDNETVGVIGLDSMAPEMTVRVNGPQAGAQIRLKIENSADPAISVETEATTTLMDGWETLTFNFLNQAEGTAAFDPAATYDRIVLFFNFGATGADVGAQTWFADDIAVAGEADGGDDGINLVDFEDAPDSYDFGAEAGFAGGVTTVIPNPDINELNPSAQVAQMQKFPGEVFGGSSLNLGENVDFGQGESFKLKVWATRPVPLLFKFEGLDQERTLSHSGSGAWETLCFDFTGTTEGPPSSVITFIFDNGVLGDAMNNPTDWTFYFDDIEQVNDCGVPDVAFPITFEDAPDSYDFGPDAGFAGGASTVIANPDASGLNTTAQVVQMQKFAGEVFGGSTLSLGGNVNFEGGPAFKMKVWATRPVPVLFKFEGLNQERTLSHTGSGTWEELCFDFTGTTSGPRSNAITFIFDNGVLGDAANNPADWTFYYDEIEQAADCGIPPAEFPIDFEDAPDSYNFGPDAGFGGGASTVIANPDASGLNTTAQVVQMQKFAGEPFGGSTLTLDGNVPFADGEVFTMKVWSARPVSTLFKFEGLNRERAVNHTGSGTWEELCFDFTGDTAGPVTNAITFIFDNGVVGDAAGDPDNWTFYYDEIQQLETCPAPEPVAEDFEGGDSVFADFEGGQATVIANPDVSGINTSANVGQMVKFAGAPFGGSTLDLGGVFPLAEGDNYLMSVRAQREVSVTFKIEPAGVERTAIHSGSGTWEQLCFDFSSVAADGVTGITLIFDNGTPGDAANDPDAWTFQFDDISQTSDACPAAEPTEMFAAITFDDPDTTYTLADFGGNMSSITNDPAGGDNMVALSVRTDAAEFFAGTTYATLPGNAIPALPLDPVSPQITVRVYAPAADTPIRLKVEDANNGAVSVEAEVRTTVALDWETLTFDFTTAVEGTPAFDPAASYTRLSIFPNFGAEGVGEEIYYVDDIDVVMAGGGGGGDPGGELAVNGGFETGDLSGWTIFENMGMVTPDNTESNGGDWSVHVVAARLQNPVLKQERLAAGTVAPGDTVNISFDMKGSAGAGGVIFPEFFSEGAMGAPNEILEVIAVPTADWTTYMYSVTAGADVTNGITFQLGVVCGDVDGCFADVFIDNVSVTLDP